MKFEPEILRLDCLREAVKIATYFSPASADPIVAAAQKMYEFVSGTEPERAKD